MDFEWILNQFGMNIESIWNEFGLDLELISNWFGINLIFFGTEFKSKWLWIDQKSKQFGIDLK